MPLVSVSLYKLYKQYSNIVYLCHFYKTNSEDDNGDFRNRCKNVRLENGAEILLTSAFVY